MLWLDSCPTFATAKAVCRYAPGSGADGDTTGGAQGGWGAGDGSGVGNRSGEAADDNKTPTLNKAQFTCAQGVWRGTLECSLDPVDEALHGSEHTSAETLSAQWGTNDITLCVPLLWVLLDTFVGAL
jgi:hypothetical protein